MELKARFSKNPLHGYQTVKRQYLRLIHLLGFKPIKENYIVVLEKKIDVRRYHKIMVQEKFNEVRFIEEYIIPGKLSAKDTTYDVFFTANEREPTTDKLEIITKKELEIKDGEDVTITIERRPQKNPIKDLGRKIFRIKKKQ